MNYVLIKSFVVADVLAAASFDQSYQQYCKFCLFITTPSVMSDLCNY